MKVYQTPTTDKLNESGIRRVIEAYNKYLPHFGIEFVNSDDKADLIASHAGSYPKPTVLHTHGLYWTADYPDSNHWEWQMNAAIISAIRYAKEVTVPSHWVAETFQRDMRFNPIVIPHGIEWQDWIHKEPNQSYILWNKNRIGDVCDPDILAKLALTFQDKTFVTTFAPKLMHNTIASGKEDRTLMQSNIKILDVIPHQRMKRIIQQAGLYLSTTKETFGIGVLEAMAAGVPVLGFAHGGNVQLIEHGVNGYLAKPNDFDDLCYGLNYCLKHRKVLGQNGQELAKKWSWLDACQIVYDVYKRALKPENEDVSVVIPVYNKTTEQVKRAIDSCLNQTLEPKQIIIVDDGSTNNTIDNLELSKFTKLIDNAYLTFHRQSNQGVAHARNNGIALTNTEYVCCLDSDDWIEPDFLKRCVNELKQDRSLGIAYTGLKWHNQDGDSGVSEWPSEFDYNLQIARKNQVPTCCVFRKEAWARIGGYKQRYAPLGAGSEDAAFWTMFGAIGYNAKQVTKKPLFNYSTGQGLVHGNPEYHEVDWLQMYPWITDQKHPFASLVAPKKWSHPVRQYDEPVISIIIPVGPGHEQDVCNALDSIEMQHFRNWEVIVVWDTHTTHNYASGKAKITGIAEYVKLAYPYTKQIYTICEPTGAGSARNRGIHKSRGNLIFFLDADDVLSSPDALDIMLEAWNQEQKIIYSDYLVKASWGTKEEALKKLDNPARLKGYLPRTQQSIISYQAANYDCALAQKQPEYSGNEKMPYYLWQLVSCLMPKKWFNDAGGFDENMKTWEDVELFWRMAKQGYCFHRVAKELILYNADSGTRREASIPRSQSALQEHKNLLKYIIDKHKGIETVGCNCGGSKGSKKRKEIVEAKMNDAQFVEIEFWPVGMAKGTPYGRPLKSITGQKINGRLIDYGGYSRSVGDRFLMHVNDQEAKPDEFRIVPPIIEVPVEKVKTPEPVAIDAKPLPNIDDTQEFEPIQINYTKMSIKNLKSTIKDASIEELNEILRQEQAGKNRKSIVKIIQNKLG